MGKGAHTITRPAVALAGVILVAALAVAGCDGGGRSPTGSSQPGVAGTASSGASAAAFGEADVMFAQMMIPHHQQAVEIAELAADRAADGEVKQLAARIKAAQAPEIVAMGGWLSAWDRPAPSGGAELPPLDHGMPGLVSEADMNRLEVTSGLEFDRQFLAVMIAHHEGAITMAEDELVKGVNADAKALAERIRTAQQAEIVTMKKILARL